MIRRRSKKMLLLEISMRPEADTSGSYTMNISIKGTESTIIILVISSKVHVNVTTRLPTYGVTY